MDRMSRANDQDRGKDESGSSESESEKEGGKTFTLSKQLATEAERVGSRREEDLHRDIERAEL